MSSESGANLAASIRARLLRLAHVSGEDYQRVLGRYGIERFLYRLGHSSYRDRFALKGATLFTLWTGQAHRPTKDLDLLGRGSSEIEDVKAVIREICAVEGQDGIVFDVKSVEGTKIKEDDEYDGVRIKFNAHLAGARIPMQVDIGFGDAVPRARVGYVPGPPSDGCAADSRLSSRVCDRREISCNGRARYPEQPDERFLRHLVHGPNLDF